MFTYCRYIIIVGTQITLNGHQFHVFVSDSNELYKIQTYELKILDFNYTHFYVSISFVR
jgi:hypothetical protein